MPAAIDAGSQVQKQVRFYVPKIIGQSAKFHMLKFITLNSFKYVTSRIVCFIPTKLHHERQTQTMKSLALIAVMFSCLFYTVYAQACDQTIFNQCHDPYVRCATNVTTTAASCACISTYGSCLGKNNCYGFGGTRDEFMTECQKMGCSAEQCSSAVANGINAALLLASVIFALYH